MNFKPSIQIQSVIYNNEVDSLKTAVTNMANAVRVERETLGYLGQVSFWYGDASPKPVLSDEQVKDIQDSVKDYVDFQYKVFGFNTGSAKGHNILGEKCDTDFMLIINPDVIASPRLLVEIIRPFSNDNVAIVEGRQSPVEHPKEYDTETFETDWATTACAMIKTQVFHELDGFDSDTFFMYCDDLDFSWRARLAGYRIIYQPSACVYHAKRIGKKGEWQPTESEKYYSAEAAILMAYKYSEPTRVKHLYNFYSTSSNEYMHKAAAHFLEMKNNGSLPAQIDPKHKVSKFLGDYYTKHRFVI